MKCPACVSFKAHLLCMRTVTDTEKIWRFIQPRFACNPHDIHPQWEKQGGGGICKGFDWTQQNSHFLSPTKRNTPVYRHFEVRPVIRKQIFPEDTVSGHTIPEVPFTSTNHAGSYLRRRLSTLPSTFRSSNWSTWMTFKELCLHVVSNIYILISSSNYTAASLTL
jgi:hypothetical protein